MASYSTMNTLPSTAVEAETPLLQRDIKINAKTLVGGAAVAAFALGALGATAMSSGPQPAPAALYSAAGDYTPGWNNIELSRDNTMCLVGAGKGVPLSVEKCTPHFGAFSQVRNDDGTVTLQSQGLCLTGLRDGSADFDAGDSFGMFTCDPAYADFQNFQLSGSYKTDLMLPASNLCVSAEGYDVVAAPCDDFSTEQNFRLVQSSANRPAPAPRPSPKPSKKKNGESCKKDSECESGDCHKGDGKYHNTCKKPSDHSPTKKPTSKPAIVGGPTGDKNADKCCGGGSACGYIYDPKSAHADKNTGCVAVWQD